MRHNTTSHTCTVFHAGGNVTKSAWAQCSCGWTGKVRRAPHLDLAYRDQNRHLASTTK